MKRYIVLIVMIVVLGALSASCYGQTGIINTIAGTGTAAYGGDGAAATLAYLNNPNEVALDVFGNIYIADWHNSRIRKINTSGVISTIAGTGAAGYNGDGIAATTAQLNNASAVFVDGAGNVYIGDYMNNRIRKVNTSGIISTVAGTGVPGYSGDGLAATAAMLNLPSGCYVDDTGNLYIADSYNSCVRKVNTSGIISTIAGTGVSGFNGDGIPAATAQLYNPYGIIMDTAHNLIIADQSNHRVRKINTAGIITTIAGNGSAGYSGDGFAATSAQLNIPSGVAIDHSGNILIADQLNNVIRKVNTSGIITTIAGTGTPGFSGDGALATTAELHQPSGVCVNAAGTIFIADFANNRIRTITFGNRAPVFTGGHGQTLNICMNETMISLDTLLAVRDSDIGQTETWSLSMPPVHGTAVVAYTTTSTGGVLTPAGLYYTPNPGYSGPDAFKVTVSDGITTDETEIDVTIGTLPDAGVISGIDSVCPGHYDTLSETVSGGIWSYSNGAINSISFPGVVRGLFPGYDTIIYTVINSCGIVSAIFPITVRADCPLEVSTISESGDVLRIFPNPATTNLTIQSASTIEEVIVTNLLGQTVYNKHATANCKLQTIDVAAWPSGVYFVKVNGSEIRKFIKS